MFIVVFEPEICFDIGCTVRFKIYFISFAGKFEIEWGETYAKGLEEGTWEGHIHVKVMSTDTTKLHVNVVVVVLVYQLKVFNAGFIHSAIEIEHEGLNLFIPLRRLVKEEHDPFCVINLKLFLECLVLLSYNNEKILDSR